MQFPADCDRKLLTSAERFRVRKAELRVQRKVDAQGNQPCHAVQQPVNVPRRDHHIRQRGEVGRYFRCPAHDCVQIDHCRDADRNHRNTERARTQLRTAILDAAAR